MDTFQVTPAPHLLVQQVEAVSLKPKYYSVCWSVLPASPFISLAWCSCSKGSPDNISCPCIPDDCEVTIASVFAPK